MNHPFRFAVSAVCFIVGAVLIVSGPLPAVRGLIEPTTWYLAAMLTGFVGGAAIFDMAVRDKSKGGAVVGIVSGIWMPLISLLLFANGEFFAWLSGGLSGCFLIVMGLLLFQGPEKLRAAAKSEA